MDQYYEWLEGLSFRNLILYRVAAVGVVLFLAWLANLIAKRYILRAIQHCVKKSKTKWDDIFAENRVFVRLSHLAPAIVIYAASALIFVDFEKGIHVMQLVSNLYMIVIGLFVVDAFLNSLVDIYRTYDFAKKLPIKGFVQIIKVVIFSFAGLAILSEIIDKDVSKLIAGMGAMTAILMLIFKDSILGLVAGIQLAANKMIHMGDWIEMPKYGADGDVIDMTLTTVKVQNWDKTISTIPAYALISDSFKNWRGMSESSGRRIKRNIYIDTNTIKFCTEDMLARFGKFQMLGDYLAKKQQEIAGYNAEQGVDDSALVNGRRLTNIGTLRAYIIEYLRSNPMINKDMTFIVRQLEPGAQGLPIQIYVFSKDKAWANYEAIQADIFDHILAVVPEFDLRLFQQPTGADFNIHCKAKH